MNIIAIQTSDNFQGGVEVKFPCPTTRYERPNFKKGRLLFGGTHSFNSDGHIGPENSYLHFTKSKFGTREGLGNTLKVCSKAWDCISLAKNKKTETSGSRSKSGLSIHGKGMVKATLRQKNQNPYETRWATLGGQRETLEIGLFLQWQILCSGWSHRETCPPPWSVLLSRVTSSSWEKRGSTATSF